MKYFKWIILAILLILGVIFIYNNFSNDKKEEKVIETSEKKKEDVNMIVKIDNVEYSVILEDNDTVNELMEMLPLTIEMNDLNNNEKYYYLNNSLSTNIYSSSSIEKGDIMLYGDNCLVLFYKSFTTSYSYTKIGHIDNLKDLDNNNIIVTIEKGD